MPARQLLFSWAFPPFLLVGSSGRPEFRSRQLPNGSAGPCRRELRCWCGARCSPGAGWRPCWSSARRWFADGENRPAGAHFPPGMSAGRFLRPELIHVDEGLGVLGLEQMPPVQVGHGSVVGPVSAIMLPDAAVEADEA